MPRSSPLTFRQITYAQAAGDGIIHIIELSHADFESAPDPIRLANYPVAVTHNSNAYAAFPFDIIMPEMREDGTFSEAKLRISAVNQQLVAVLRGVTTPVDVSHFTVFISDPDTVAHGPFPYEIRGAQSYNRQSLDLVLTFSPVLFEECPWKRLSPGRAPGLF